MIGALLLCAFRQSSSVEVNPKLPSMNSEVSFGLFTPAAWTMKSASEQKRSSSSSVDSLSYSYISWMDKAGLVRFFPSLIAFKFSTRLRPNAPAAPVINTFMWPYFPFSIF